MPIKSSTRHITITGGIALCVSGIQAQTLAATQPGPATGADLVHSGQPTTADVHLAAPSSQFPLGTADVIHVSVWKNAELSQTLTVGPDGFVAIPLLGDVHAAGLTTNELAQDLKTKLSTYVVNAQVVVSIVEIHSRQVFVTGQVGRPGAYPLIAPITILQLVAQAGGLNTFANRKQIFVLRSTNSQIARLRFNYTSAIRGDMKQNIVLQPGDTVIVP